LIRALRLKFAPLNIIAKTLQFKAVLACALLFLPGQRYGKKIIPGNISPADELAGELRQAGILMRRKQFASGRAGLMTAAFS